MPIKKCKTILFHIIHVVKYETYQIEIVKNVKQ